jgi:hypothetical protein
LQTTEHPLIAVNTRQLTKFSGAHPEPPGTHLPRVRERPLRSNNARILSRPRQALTACGGERPRARDGLCGWMWTVPSSSPAPTGWHSTGWASRANSRRSHSRGHDVAAQCFRRRRGTAAVVTAALPWRTDIEASQYSVTCAIRSGSGGERVGATCAVLRIAMESSR